MGRKSLDSPAIGGEVLKYFITIVNLIFQRFSSKYEQTDCDIGEERKKVLIGSFVGLNGSWINLKVSKFGEIHLTGT